MFKNNNKNTSVMSILKYLLEYLYDINLYIKYNFKIIIPNIAVELYSAYCIIIIYVQKCCTNKRLYKNVF